MSGWIFQWEVLILMAITWGIIILILKHFNKDPYHTWDWCDTLLLFLPFAFIPGAFIFETNEICADSIETWQEASGLFTTTKHYALINETYTIRLNSPFQIKQGDCITLQKKSISGYHIKPAPFWYS